jgi:hypothetical protein
MITYRTWPVNKNSAFRIIFKGFSGFEHVPPEKPRRVPGEALIAPFRARRQ